MICLIYDENVSCIMNVWFPQGLGRVSPPQMSGAKEDSTSSQDDATDEIMDRLVKSVTQNPSERPSSPKTRKRSRLNRKSCECARSQRKCEGEGVLKQGPFSIKEYTLSVSIFIYTLDMQCTYYYSL